MQLSPKDEKDILIAASNNQIVCYDNLSGGVKGAMSDVICAVASGTGISGRKLYSNFDEESMSAQSSVILNRIDTLAKASDLAQRTITLELDRPAEFVASADLQALLEGVAPTVLGAILDAVSAAIRNLPQVSRDRTWTRPRLADFAEWVRAAEEALPWDVGCSLQAIRDAHRSQRADMLEGDDLLSGILRLLDRQNGSVRDTATGLLNQITEVADVDADLPKNGRALSAFLKRAKTDYEEAGGVRITLNADRDEE